MGGVKNFSRGVSQNFLRVINPSFPLKDCPERFVKGAFLNFFLGGKLGFKNYFPPLWGFFWGGFFLIPPKFKNLPSFPKKAFKKDYSFPFPKKIFNLMAHLPSYPLGFLPLTKFLKPGGLILNLAIPSFLPKFPPQIPNFGLINGVFPKFPNLSPFGNLKGGFPTSLPTLLN